MPVTNFFWEPLSDNILQERDEFGALIAEYTTEPGLYANVISQNRSGVESQFHFDAIGSTLALTDSNEQVSDTRAYSAFGETTESSGEATFPFQYVGRTGYFRDTVGGQDAVRRRQYYPTISRWMSQDVLGLWDSPTPYTYGRNRPTQLLDPSGTLTIEPAPGQVLVSSCGAGPIRMSWDFLLDTKLGARTGAPCVGWLIQKVQVTCFRGSCDRTNTACCTCDDTEVLDTYDYFEAWKIDPGQRRSRIEKVVGSAFTDRAEFQPIANKCGTYLQKGELKFYCEDWRENPPGYWGFVGDLEKQWRRGVTHHPGECQTTSGILLSSTVTPWAWRFKPLDSGSRGFTASWFCCRCRTPKDFAKGQASPSSPS